MGADRCHTEMPGEYLHSRLCWSIVFHRSLWALVTASRLMGLLGKPAASSGTLQRGWWQTQGQNRQQASRSGGSCRWESRSSFCLSAELEAGTVGKHPPAQAIYSLSLSCLEGFLPSSLFSGHSSRFHASPPLRNLPLWRRGKKDSRSTCVWILSLL